MGRDDEYPRVIRILPEDMRQEAEERRKRQEAERRAAEERDDAFKRAVIQIAESLKGDPQPLPAEPEPDRATRHARREAMLLQWESETGGKRTHIWAKKHITSRTQFYRWLSGELRQGSPVTRKIEAYLQSALEAARAHVPKNSRDRAIDSGT